MCFHGDTTCIKALSLGSFPVIWLGSFCWTVKFSVLSYVYLFLFSLFCFRSLSCVSNVASVSALSIRGDYVVCSSVYLYWQYLTKKLLNQGFLLFILKSSLRTFPVATMTWLHVMEYLCHKRRVCMFHLLHIFPFPFFIYDVSQRL